MSIQLTQLSSVKSRVGIIASDTTDDAILGNTINALSQRITNECNRNFDYQAADVWAFRGNEMDLRVPRYPIQSVATFAVKESEVLGWVVVTGADIPDFMINPAGNIIELSVALGNYRQQGQVTYAGGYILPGGTKVTGVPALPDDLEQAVIEQVAYWYQRREQLGLVSISGDGGSVSQFRSLDLLPGVLAVVKKYTRWMM